MSDSEFEEFASAQKSGKVKNRKRKPLGELCSKSESEFEDFAPAPKTGRGKKQPAKRKSTADSLSRQQVVGTVDTLFGLHTDDEAHASLKPIRASLPSYLAKRVSTGTLRRSAATDGNFYLELRVYHRSDAESTAPEERWKKALLRLCCLLDEESTQWKLLQRLIRDTSGLFDSVEPTMV